MKKDKQYLRFRVYQRVEHWTMFISFTMLAITGLPQKFVGQAWAEAMIVAMGGIEFVRIIHRFSATALMLVAIFHAGAVAYKIIVQRLGLTMMPSMQDVKDGLAVIAYNVGLRKDHPKLPRYNFEEKVEYWALLWGTVVMIITGFILWNPIASAQLFPGSFIPAAKAAHGAEAILAVLAVIIWHMYGVHIRRFNKSMFTGKLEHDQMEHDHKLELEEIENGTVRGIAPDEERAKRRKIFVPVAMLITAISVGILFFFVTFEQTAITTVEASEIIREEDGFHPVDDPLGNGGSLHTTITEYTGPESCAASGCHTGQPLETAAASLHSQRMAVAGPDPLLAKMIENATPAGDTTPNCLLCHAKDYNPDDLVASAQTVGPAGGETCTRCHDSVTTNGVHDVIGLGCVGCHRSVEHQIQTSVECSSCHMEQPHQDPFINSKHQNLDCRTCHIADHGTELVADTSQSTQNPINGFFQAKTTSSESEPKFAWQAKNGDFLTEASGGAKIAPVTMAEILAPEGFDPILFAETGDNGGVPSQKNDAMVAPGHNIIKESTRTCENCHGPEATFDFAALGYDEETAEQFSLK